MKKLYDKNKILFALLWIASYCLLASVGDNLSADVGIEKVFTLPVLTGLSLIAFLFVKNNGLLQKYGLCKAERPASQMLFYIPLVVLLSANLWHGLAFNLSFGEALLYILSMVFVGFLEEIIFRGFLFDAMLENSPKAAVVVSSVTFGMGHIINLINGSGAELVPNLLQVVYAIAAGFMFVMIYLRSKSLVPCIVTHSLFNALSVFADESILTIRQQVFSCILITVISGGYAAYLAFLKPEKIKE